MLPIASSGHNEKFIRKMKKDRICLVIRTSPFPKKFLMYPTVKEQREV
jgi:hypothetical protein